MTMRTHTVEERVPLFALALGLGVLVLDRTATRDHRVLQSFRHARKAQRLLQFRQIEAQLSARRASPAEQVVKGTTFFAYGVSIRDDADQGPAARHAFRETMENPAESRLFKKGANPRDIRRRFHRRAAEVCARSTPNA